jgi:hypothetical protein
MRGNSLGESGTDQIPVRQIRHRQLRGVSAPFSSRICGCGENFLRRSNVGGRSRRGFLHEMKNANRDAHCIICALVPGRYRMLGVGGISIIRADCRQRRAAGHHHPKTKLPIQARLIATSVNKPTMAPRWCVTIGLSLTGWFIA